VEREPDFVDARYALGVALSRLGREHFPQAVDEFLDVLRRRPGDIDAWVDLSSILAEEGDAPAAAAQLEQAIRLEPANTDLYILLGKTQLDFGESSQALESFGKAAKLNPKLSAAHYGLGLTLRKQHDPVRAAEEFRTALVLNQQDPISRRESFSVPRSTSTRPFACVPIWLRHTQGWGNSTNMRMLLRRLKRLIAKLCDCMGISLRQAMASPCCSGPREGMRRRGPTSRPSRPEKTQTIKPGRPMPSMPMA
jgi:tetratricopeptide (TPR) repeat protein